jgi:hypothetical protein
VKTFPVPRQEGGPDINYILINDVATLTWAGNMAALELHPFLHRVPKLDNPTHVVFDLDPGEGANIFNCAEVAFLLRDVLTKLRLKSFAKVSGSKGIQVYVPLNTPITYDATQPFARAIAELLEREHVDLVVSDMAKNLRVGKVIHRLEPKRRSQDDSRGLLAARKTCATVRFDAREMGRASESSAKKRCRPFGIRSGSNTEALETPWGSLRTGTEGETKTPKRIRTPNESKINRTTEVARSVQCQKEFRAHVRTSARSST